MAPDGAPTLADQVSKLYDLIAGFHATHLLEIARQLGVWEALTERPGTTSADLAGRLGTDAFYTDVLCRTAFSFGLLARDGEVGGTNPIDRPAWRLVLRLNDLGAVPPAVPLLQFHGRADQIIPWEVEAALHRRWCALGVTTQLNGYDGDHVQAAFLAQADVVRWLEDRFAGRPAAANC